MPRQIRRLSERSRVLWRLNVCPLSPWVQHAKAEEEVAGRAFVDDGQLGAARDALVSTRRRKSLRIGAGMALLSHAVTTVEGLGEP